MPERRVRLGPAADSRVVAELAAHLTMQRMVAMLHRMVEAVVPVAGGLAGQAVEMDRCAAAFMD